MSTLQSKHALFVFGRYIWTQLTNTMSLTAYFEPIVRSFIQPDYRHGLNKATLKRVDILGENLYTLTLKSEQALTFKAGQYIQLYIDINGKRLTRCFSLSCSPKTHSLTKELELTIKAKESGSVSRYLVEQLELDGSVHLSQPSGEFVVQNTRQPKLFLAGGSGLSPILSMLRSLPSADLKHCTLLYFQRTTVNEALIELLKPLVDQGLSLTTINTTELGHFNADMAAQVMHEHSDLEAYICGPGRMISECKSVLVQQGLPEQAVFSERFGPDASAINHLDIDEEIGEITLEFAHSKTTFNLDKAESKSSLLQIAEQRGLKPLSGCKIGVCHQCVCQKKSGRVYNLKTNRISDTSSEEIQLCQSVPLSDLVIEA